MEKIKGAMLAAVLAAGVSMGVTANAQAGDYSGDFQIKAGVSGVLPNSDFGDIVLNGNALAGADAEVDDSWVPTLTLAYFVNKNIALELFCCFAQHGIDGKGILPGLGAAELGETMIFPPILTLQYHFDTIGGFKPYVGAGVQFIHFFDESSEIGGSLELDSAWGFSLQGGVDYELGNGLYVGADVRYTWLDTEAHFRNTQFGDIDTKLDLDPLIVSAHVGYRFNLFNRTASYEPMK